MRLINVVNDAGVRYASFYFSMGADTGLLGWIFIIISRDKENKKLRW